MWRSDFCSDFVSRGELGLGGVGFTGIGAGFWEGVESVLFRLDFILRFLLFVDFVALGIMLMGFEGGDWVDF